jgi:hypothetical protein
MEYWKFTVISEVLGAFIIRAMNPDDRGRSHLFHRRTWRDIS